VTTGAPADLRQWRWTIKVYIADDEVVTGKRDGSVAATSPN